MTRLRGRSLRGTRCHGSAPGGTWETTTILSSVRLDGTTKYTVYKGGTNKVKFEAYVGEILAPSLHKGDIVILDNLSAHKSEDAQKMIERRGAKMLFLPAYSPDFNPIEKMWSKTKQIVRGLEPRSHNALIEAGAYALSMVTPKNILGWFTSCGY